MIDQEQSSSSIAAYISSSVAAYKCTHHRFCQPDLRPCQPPVQKPCRPPPHRPLPCQRQLLCQSGRLRRLPLFRRPGLCPRAL
uniref:Uncharacterized protein n=1 Tax=Oryza brachyantha TaxID=4533 RepID=J3KXC0_ORYBR